MAKRSKAYRADFEKVDPEEKLPLDEAIAKLQSFSKRKFDQSVEVSMHLGIDPKQADQLVRGAIALPHGIGASKRVIAFCDSDKVEACKEAGAIEAGGEELVKKVDGGWMEFDVAVADPAMMKVVSRLGRVLGPKGLMPSPKSGTVTPDIEQAVREYAAGKVEYRNDKFGNVQAVVGKQSFDSQQLKENAEAFIHTIIRSKPTSTKGHYIKKVAVSMTMSPAVQVAV